MKNRYLSLFLCLCLVFAMLLPMLSACNESGDEQHTTEQPKDQETSEPNEESGADSTERR